MILGSHVQMKAPLFLEGSVKEALSYNANALMLYTGAPQNTKRRKMEEMHIAEAQKLMADNGLDMDRMIVHAPYIINPANSTKPYVAELAHDFLISEMQRTHEIGARYMILHPGSYTDTDLSTGIQTIIKCLNGIDDYPEGLCVCLETMAGKGSEVGYRFEQLAEILEGVKYPEHFGICLDTCHIHDAGYDMSDFDGILDEFDHILGMDKLKVIHLNDSLNERGARKDRHANIGEGKIGFEALYAAASNARTQNIAKILETPYINKKPPYGIEIAMLQSGIYDPMKLEQCREA